MASGVWAAFERAVEAVGWGGGVVLPQRAKRDAAPRLLDDPGAAEARPGGFGDAGAPVAGRSAAGGADGRRADPADTEADAAADRAGPAAGRGQEPVAGGAAPGGVSEAGDGCVRQARPGVAAGTGVERGRADGGRHLADGGRSSARSHRAAY